MIAKSLIRNSAPKLFPHLSSAATCLGYRIFDIVVVADPATPPLAGFTSTTIGAAIEAARVAGKPLQVRPGSYSVSNIDILTTNGAGRGIEVYCLAGIARSSRRRRSG
ncbi:hypothetical protein [Bosea sp. PAMC 26642]|uniref:hypothetical protein n=1 Tax=Bosea sp. (strain PAMC 26642) TaxID=1792307 RepID=UPI000B23CB6A|nr:hypothetical protein [Bosea sp. PAMC 26642]